jgi:hypothetical protein
LARIDELASTIVWPVFKAEVIAKRKRHRQRKPEPRQRIFPATPLSLDPVPI